MSKERKPHTPKTEPESVVTTPEPAPVVTETPTPVREPRRTDLGNGIVRIDH